MSIKLNTKKALLSESLNKTFHLYFTTPINGCQLLCKNFLEELGRMPQTQQKTNITQFELSNQIFDYELFSKVKLTASARLVLIVLCRYYPKIYPCQNTIANKTGLSVRSVINAISELKQKGLILVECNHNNVYKFSSKFFELTKIADSTGKICTKQRAEIAHNKTNYKNNKKPFQNTNNEISYLNPEKTKKQIEQSKNLKKGSPLDYSKPEAIIWLNSLPEILKNSYFAREVRKKYKLN